MKNRVRVTFEMQFDTEGPCESEITFSLPDYPEIKVPETIIKSVISEIAFLIPGLMGVSAKAMAEKHAVAPPNR